MIFKDKLAWNTVNRIVKWFLLIYLCLSHVQHISGQRCAITDVEQDSFISLPIISIGQPSTLATYNMENTINIINITNNADSGKIFINADYNDNMQALTLFTTDDFPNYAEFEERTTIIVTISFTCVSLTRDITFSQPLQVSNDHDPEFLQPVYEFRIPLPLPANFDLTVFQEIAARDIDIGDNGVTFSAESDFITVGTSADPQREPKTYYATMITKTQILSIVHNIAFEITATDIGGRSSTVAVYIESDGENTFIMRPIFERALYTGIIDEDFNLIMSSSVILDTETYDEVEVVFSLQGDDSGFFTFTNIQNVINIQLQGEVVEEELEEKNFLQFMVVATRTGVEEGATVVLIDLLKTCPEVTIPTTEEPTPCPEVTCPTVPTEPTGPTEPTPDPPTQPPPELCPDPEGPVFQEDFYTYRVFYGQLGGIGTVRASHADESALDVIEYSLNFKDDDLLGKIEIDTASGEISILDQLVPEVYGFEVFASIVVDGDRKVGRALVTVIVQANEQCSPTPVETSLMVRRLKENAEHEIMSTLNGNCEFHILGFQPNDQEYFYIENQLLKSIELDREAEIFADMLIPQFQISLKLECPEVRRKRSISWFANSAVPRDLEGPKEYVYTNDIPHASTVTVINVIVDDENDNKPEIVFPTAESGLIYGYPEPSLAEKLLLSNVLQVRAIDRDEGENAVIKYALHETNAHFTIDSETGVIYPKRNALASSTIANLRVIATDRVEDEGTLQGANVNIAIHRLSFENIAVVAVEDVALTDADAVRQSIHNVSDARIIILHSTNIPGVGESSFLRQSSDIVDMKFLVYGFTNERLLNTPQIEQRLNDVTEKYDAKTSPLEEIISFIGDDEDVTGYIVGLSVLAAAVLALLIAAFWGWWKWIRPYEYKTMENESVTSEDNGLNPDFDKRAVLEGHIPEPIRLSETYNDPERLSPTAYPTPATLENGSVETGELRDEPKPESPPKERRKSIVTFNEDVERIEIVTEVPADTQSDSEKEVYKF